MAFENEKVSLYVKVRPGVSEFLQKMSSIYDIYIFTASTKLVI